MCELNFTSGGLEESYENSLRSGENRRIVQKGQTHDHKWGFEEAWENALRSEGNVMS